MNNDNPTRAVYHRSPPRPTSHENAHTQGVVARAEAQAAGYDTDPPNGQTLAETLEGPDAPDTAIIDGEPYSRDAAITELRRRESHTEEGGTP